MGNKTDINFHDYRFYFAAFIILLFSLASYAGERGFFPEPAGLNSFMQEQVIISDSDGFNSDAVELEDQAVGLFWEDRLPDKAVPIFEEALEMEPRLVYASLYIALYHRVVTGDVKRAIKTLQEAIKYHPEIGLLYSELAEIYFVNKEFKKAIKYYQKALRAGLPERPDIFHKIAQANYNLEKYEKCIEYCDLALAINPFQPRCKDILIRACILEGRDSRALELVGDSLAYYKLAGALHIYNQDNSKARKAVEKALEIDPDDDEVRFNQALIYQKDGRLKEALGILNKILITCPDNHDVLLHKGICLAKLGETGEALSIFKNLDKLYPQDTRAKCMIGDIYYQQGRLRESLKIYDLVKAVEPNNNYASMMINIISGLVE